MKKVLVPVYDKRFNDQMMDYIKNYGVDKEYEVTLLHVTAQPNYYQGEGVLSDDRFSGVNYSDIIPHIPTSNFQGSEQLYDKMGDEIILSCAAQLKAAGVKNIVNEVFKGDAATKIIKLARDGKFDLIIMNTHKMSCDKKFPIGSVANKVVHHAPCDVIVVRKCEKYK